MIVRCEECGRTFNLLIPEQSDDWNYGHDCEPMDGPTPEQEEAYRNYLTALLDYRIKETER